MNATEPGEEELKRACTLLTSGRISEALIPIENAEHWFLEKDGKRGLVQVYLNKSRMHLFLGETDLALESIQRADDLAQRLDQPFDDIELVFQRALVYLQMGDEERAHRDLTRYIELTEAREDGVAQARGHFFLALVYERHGEPCMAAADLEMGRDAARDLPTPVPYVRLVSFLAHLWIKRGILEEAEVLHEEALHRSHMVPEIEGTPSQGLTMLVDAEIEAIRSNWEASERSFHRALAILNRSNMRYYYEALARSWYGEILVSQGRITDGREVLGDAIAIFERLGNATQAQKLRRFVAEAEASSSPVLKV